MSKQDTKEVGFVEVELSDGRTAKVMLGRGCHIIKATQIMTSQEEMPAVLASLLTEIDGKAVQVEEIKELPISDYTKVMEAFQRINPLSVSTK